MLTNKQLRDGVRNSEVGKHFTDLEMQAPDGKKVRLSDYVARNRLTLLDFWASWCGPCCAEIPNMKKALQAHAADGFGIVGVSLDSKAGAWKSAIEKYQIDWPQMSNVNGGCSDGALLYGISAIPATYLIDSHGTIVAKNVRGGSLITKVAEFLGK